MCLEDRKLLDFESFLSRHNFFIFFLLSCLHIAVWHDSNGPDLGKCKVLILFYGFTDLFVYKEISQLITNKQMHTHTEHNREKS